MGEVTVWYGDVPPSLNKTGSRGNWRQFHHAKKLWQATVETLLLDERGRQPFPGPVTASGALRFKTRRRRDEGNFRSLLEKAVGDALTNGGWIPDDTPDYYRFGELLLHGEPGPPKTYLRFTWRDQ